MIRLAFRVTGTVQGVFFRASAVEQARALGLLGFVRNVRDGAVEGRVAGPADAVGRFVVWLHEGPEDAVVTEVRTQRRAGRDTYDDFDQLPTIEAGQGDWR